MERSTAADEHPGRSEAEQLAQVHSAGIWAPRCSTTNKDRAPRAGTF
jgi:hypothetical protein